jgi:hypothetical protein
MTWRRVRLLTKSMVTATLIHRPKRGFELMAMPTSLLDVFMPIREDWMKQTTQMHETGKKKEEITNIIEGGQNTKDNLFGRTRRDNVGGQTTNRRDNV